MFSLGKSLPEALQYSSDNYATSTESSKDYDEILLDVPFVDHNSDSDDERKEARCKMRSYVVTKKAIQKQDGVVII